MKKYVVKLTKQEREGLVDLVSRGKGAAGKLTHARILLKVDSSRWGEHWTDEEVSKALDVNVRTIERLRERFVEEGFEAALTRRQRKRSRRPILGGRDEAQLTTLACSESPDGEQRWTLQLLADRMVELKYVDSISRETVRRTLKK